VTFRVIQPGGTVRHVHCHIEVLTTDGTPSGRAMAVHRLLAADSQHRNFRLPDLIIAATAEEHGATVLHYDADYDRISAVTGQPSEWVAPKGSL
ncbi:PIN domain-containing protein, partial [Micromonospora zamorensis]|uniref:PIN domain-containing protein n=1 Tax=Micromonospora zamorensis TaxID=709883 RepID=UPI0033F0CE84